MDNSELKHAVELSFNTTISLLEKAGITPANDELRKALPEVLSALEAVEKLREAVDKFIMAKNLPGDHCEMDQAEIFGIEALAATEPKP